MCSQICGLDFGTTNSAIGVVSSRSQLELVPLEGSNRIIPSALFFDYDTSLFHYGQSAKDMYVQGDEGRLLMSLKSILGTDTIESTTFINGMEFNFYDIIGYILRNIKEKAEHFNNEDVNHVVLGRPVFFNESNPEKDRRAQRVLSEIATRQGFKTIEFQFEPIAAALAYESTIDSEQLALIVDIGGGTSDFSVIKLSPNQHSVDRSGDILSNLGMYLGGNVFDRLISINHVMEHFGKGTTFKSTTGTELTVPTSYYNDFSTWHRIQALYTNREKEFIENMLMSSSDPKLIKRFLYAVEYELGHIISSYVESAKIELSGVQQTEIVFDILKDPFTVELTAQQVIEDIDERVEQVRRLITETIQQAGVSYGDIDTVFFTGGSTKIEAVRRRITDLAPQANIVEGDAFGSVALGLTIDAQNRFR